MTNEEMQKAVEFILNRQGQFVADIQKLNDSQAATNQLINRLAAVTVKGFEDTNAKINALIDAQMRTEESLKKTDEAVNAKIDALADAQIRTEGSIKQVGETFNAKINALVEAQGRTDEAVRNLAELVDRQLRERRNGG